MKAEYLITHLPQRTQEDIAKYCALRRCTLDEIWAAQESSISEMAKVHGLIVFLARKRHSINVLAKAANVSVDKVKRTLEIATRPEFSIATQKWGA